MYIARFSYEVLPVNRQRAIDFIRQEVEAARINGLNSRLLVPFTRGPSGPALQFEIELTNLNELDQFRSRGLGSSEETGQLLHSFSEILLSPPCVEILRVEECGTTGAHSAELVDATSFLPHGGSTRSHRAGGVVAYGVRHRSSAWRSPEWTRRAA
jgi:hypothetical protein